MGLVAILFLIAAVLAGVAAFGVRSPIHLGWAAVSLMAVAFAVNSGVG